MRLVCAQAVEITTLSASDVISFRFMLQSYKKKPTVITTIDFKNKLLKN
jgi:hypothetical protein